MSEYVELFIDQGEDYEATIVLGDEETNALQNVDGYIVTSSLRRSLLSVNATASFACSVTDSANGELTISMDAANTFNLHPGTHVFDIRYVSNGRSKKLLEGVVFVSYAITKG